MPNALIDCEVWLQSAAVRPSTRRVYASRLRQLAQFMHASGYAEDSHMDLNVLARDFVSVLQSEYMLKPRSINNFLALFRLIARVTGQSFNELNEIPVPGACAKTLTPEEQERFLQSAFKRCRRDRLLAYIFLKTNIRIGECVNIRVSDLKFESDHLKVLIRGRAGERSERLPDELNNLVHDWLMERERSFVGSQSEYLFFGPTGQRITTTSVDMVLRKIGYDARLEVCARVLRQTYFSFLLSGQNIASVRGTTLSSRRERRPTPSDKSRR